LPFSRLAVVEILWPINPCDFDLGQSLKLQIHTHTPPAHSRRTIAVPIAHFSRLLWWHSKVKKCLIKFDVPDEASLCYLLK
jgi:hypothetical protein